jgi:Fe-S-cluster containining protein
MAKKKGMNDLITNLEWIAAQKPNQTQGFEMLRKAIQPIPVTRFDALVHPIVAEVTAGIDCTQCGNCCKQQEPGVSAEEIEKLATFNHQSTADFMASHVAWDKEGVSFLCTQPCVFLNHTTCSIYTHRPLACADFPGLHRPRLKWRMRQVEENYSLCPIVFNVVEKLKQVLEPLTGTLLPPLPGK